MNDTTQNEPTHKGNKIEYDLKYWQDRRAALGERERQLDKEEAIAGSILLWIFVSMICAVIVCKLFGH